MNTGERLVRLETKVDDISKEQRNAHVESRESFAKIYEKLDTMEARFAAKWVEKVAIGILIAGASGVLGGIIYLI